MYRFEKIGKFNILKISRVSAILNDCGKDMADKYGLHHWDNPYVKSLLIVELCALRNSVYLLFKSNRPVAAFMTRVQGEELHFEKLGTLPAESGKGIGSICMRKIEEIAKRQGCKKVVMEVYEPSKHAISFYLHKGYRMAGIKDTLKYKVIKMEKSI